MEREENLRLSNMIHENGKLSQCKKHLTKDCGDYIKNYECCQGWLNNIPSKFTYSRYLRNFVVYCHDLNLNPDEILRLKPTMTEIQLHLMSELQKGKTPKEIQPLNENQGEHILNNYLNNTPRKDKLGIKVSVCSFYKNCGRSLNPVLLSRWRQRDKQSTEYTRLETKDIKQLVSNCDDPRSELLVYLLSSSGLRRGSIPLLTFGDLYYCVEVDDDIKLVRWGKDWKKDYPNGELNLIYPLHMNIGNEKLKGKYHNVRQLVFLHFKILDCIERLKKWLRHTYKYEITPDTPLIMSTYKGHKPLTTSRIRDIIVELSHKTFGETRDRQISPHDFRRYFNTTIESTKNIPYNWGLKLMGKKVRSENSPYSLPKMTQLHQSMCDSISFFVGSSEPLPNQNLHRRITRQEEQLKKQSELLQQQSEHIKKTDKFIPEFVNQLELSTQLMVLMSEYQKNSNLEDMEKIRELNEKLLQLKTKTQE